MMALNVSKANSNVIYAGYFDIGLWRSDNGGYSWVSCNDSLFTGSWRGHGGNVATILSDPFRESVVWASQSENQNGEFPTYLIRSDSFGRPGTWQTSDSGLPRIEIMGLSLDPNSPISNRTLYVTAGGNVYKSVDDGWTWTRVLNCNGCRFTAVSVKGDIIYAGGESGLWKSEDGGDSWIDVSHPDMYASTGVSFWDWNYEGIFTMYVDPDSFRHIYVVVYGANKGLYRSKDGGNSWEHILVNDFLRDVLIVRNGENSIIFAASSSAFQSGGYHPDSRGILYSADDGLTWQESNDGLAFPFGIIMDYKDSVIWVGSPGQGFMKASLNVLLNNPSTGDSTTSVVKPNDISTSLNNLSYLNPLGQKVGFIPCKVPLIQCFNTLNPPKPVNCRIILLWR